MVVARDSLNEDTITLLSEKLKAWDENFRVLTDINASLSRVEEDLRASRESRDTEIPTSTPSVPRGIRPINNNFQPIKLKDAIESVPVFDGHRPPIFQFLRACERARSMVPRSQEPYLVKLLMNKLRGHAFLAVEDGVVLTLNDFGNRLKNMFGPGKTINEYRGELATVFQRPGEEILDYIDRVKNLRLAIMDEERYGFDTVSADVQDTIDWDTAEAFVKGLPNEVFMRVKLAGYQSLDDAFCQAVRATRELKQVNNRSQCQRLGNNRQDRRFVPPTQNRPNVPRQNFIMCNYCKKPGHLVRDCYKFKARVDAGIIVPYASGQSGNQTNPSRGGSEPRRSNAINRSREQATTRRPELTVVDRTQQTTPVKPTNITVKPSSSRAQKQLRNPENQRLTKKEDYKKANKYHRVSDSDSDVDLSGWFQ